MKNIITILFFALLTCAASIDVSNSVQTQTTINNIIDTFIAKGNTKETFKVWHSIYRPSYEINTELGINKYRVFKANLKEINEHNSKNLSWKAGINNYSDMTAAELENYFNIKEIKAEDYKKSFRGLLSLDDYDDSQDNTNPDPPQSPSVQGKKFAVDWTSKMNVIRNQGSCGSCWTFSVTGAVEGNYAANKSVLSPVLSTQQLVDCDVNNGGNWGCSGGWMRHANTYYQTKGIMDDVNYPYKAVNQSCQYNAAKLSVVKVVGMETTSSHDVGMFTVLKNGPMSICVNVQSAFYSYKTGLYDATCTLVCHHAVVLLGWVGDDIEGNHWLVRNSWGTSWGEMGNFRVKDKGLLNSYSCMVGHASYALRPITN